MSDDALRPRQITNQKDWPHQFACAFTCSYFCLSSPQKAEALNPLTLITFVSNLWPFGNLFQNFLYRSLVNTGLDRIFHFLNGPEAENQITGTDSSVGGIAFSWSWMQIISLAIGILWTFVIVWVTFRPTRLLSHSVDMHIEMLATCVLTQW